MAELAALADANDWGIGIRLCWIAYLQIMMHSAKSNLVAKAATATVVHSKPLLKRGRGNSFEQHTEATQLGEPIPSIAHDFGQMPILGNSPIIQPKLSINQLGDAYEQEADRMAERVAGFPMWQGRSNDQSIQHYQAPVWESFSRVPSSLIQRSSDSPSGSDSSGSGARRSLWDKVREAASGVWEAGPVDAWDAGMGEDREAAEEFADQFPDYWRRNAARHGVWQARLTFKHGAATARAIGDAHERGVPEELDSWIDQYNNIVARRIGQSVTSLDEIPAAVQSALDDGRLITNPGDERIPASIRNATSQADSSTAYRPSL